ncbi:MAG TPA: TIM barrel protein [Terriglobia bacterium]|nr:TIM barrel protein [Terriglobia bacterium]
MKRRDFLACLFGGAAAAKMGSVALAQSRSHHAAHRAPPAPVKLDRVGISSWSFHNHFPSTRESSVSAPAQPLALLDFPEMIADRYKVHNLEFVAPHFSSLEPAYLQELKANLVRVHSRLINIPVDIPEIWHGGGLSDPDASVREAAIETSQKWIDIAKQLGARSVRCDPGGFNPDDLTLTIDSYRKLAAYGRAKNVAVLIENHGEIGSQHPEALVQVFRAVGGPFIGALPDFGNFPDNETRLRGLPLLFPYARTVCHAKGLNLDANGNETAFDFQKCVEIAKSAAFKGIYSIEYEGSGDAYAGVQAVVNELIRYL